MHVKSWRKLSQSATLASVIVTNTHLPRLPRPCWPVVVAATALPRWMTRLVFAHPLVPARLTAEAAGFSLRLWAVVRHAERGSTVDARMLHLGEPARTWLSHLTGRDGSAPFWRFGDRHALLSVAIATPRTVQCCISAPQSCSGNVERCLTYNAGAIFATSLHYSLLSQSNYIRTGIA